MGYLYLVVQTSFSWPQYQKLVHAFLGARSDSHLSDKTEPIPYSLTWKSASNVLWQRMRTNIVKGLTIFGESFPSPSPKSDRSFRPLFSINYTAIEILSSASHSRRKEIRCHRSTHLFSYLVSSHLNKNLEEKTFKRMILFLPNSCVPGCDKTKEFALCVIANFACTNTSFTTNPQKMRIRIEKTRGGGGICI